MRVITINRQSITDDGAHEMRRLRRFSTLASTPLASHWRGFVVLHWVGVSHVCQLLHGCVQPRAASSRSNNSILQQNITQYVHAEIQS